MIKFTEMEAKDFFSLIIKLFLCDLCGYFNLHQPIIGGFMKVKLFFVFVILFNVSLFAQNNEYYFRFNINNHSELQTLSPVISIDNIEGNTVYAYANDK